MISAARPLRNAEYNMIALPHRCRFTKKPTAKSLQEAQGGGPHQFEWIINARTADTASSIGHQSRTGCPHDPSENPCTESCD